MSSRLAHSLTRASIYQSRPAKIARGLWILLPADNETGSAVPIFSILITFSLLYHDFFTAYKSLTVKEYFHYGCAALR